jgi:very-long-chain (3R)-3-hydroxyacyl-CoA dehydratase
MFKITYTKLYNVLGISVIFYGLVNAVLYQVHKERKYLFRAGLAQTFFLLEIFNIIIGISRSTYIPTLIQVSSRVYVIWTSYIHKIQNTPLTLLLVCWNISDLIRYAFYLFRSRWLKSLRYNAFIILYPIGIALEIYLTNCVYLMHTNYKAKLLGAIMLLYIPLFPYLYYHMLTQRKRSTKIFEVNKKKKLSVENK